MTTQQENTKRIAKNTLMLYARMLFMMAVSLFTSRITLATLGITDYGICNVVGGLVSMFSIISGSLSVSISRFITMEVGKGNEKKLNTIFSTSVSIQLFMSIVICILAEFVGLWFLNNKMVLPSDRLYAAHWVFHLSILTFIIDLICVPYNAVIIAHEKMSAFAYMSILDVILKLIIVYMLYISPFDKLIAFSALMTCVAIVMRIVYGTYCKRHFSEAHYRPHLDRGQLREMFGFIGWTFWGNGVVVLKDQGTNMILNIFCGPAVNAARGVAMQVNSAVYGFVQNFMTAVNPQITKSYSTGAVTDMHTLMVRSAKFSFFILLTLLMPVCANLDYILGLWLVEVPEHTANFIILVLIYSLFDCYVNPLITGVLAEGRIKYYEIALTFIYIANFIASYVFLKLGYQPEWVFLLNILFKFLVVIALLWSAKRQFSFPVKTFIYKCALRNFIVFLLCSCFIILLPISHVQSFVMFVSTTLIIVLFCILCISVIGMTKNERIYIVNIIKTKLHIRHLKYDSNK